MDIMELGAIGELVGGLAVLVTLFYLAVQLRHGTQVAQYQVQQESSRLSSELFMQADRETFDLFTRLATDTGQLSDSDYRYIQAKFVAVVNYYETLFYAWRRGDVEADVWESRCFRMANFIGPVRDPLWNPSKRAFGQSFREFVDRDLLSQDLPRDLWFVGTRT